jgi:hypothetical protein
VLENDIVPAGFDVTVTVEAARHGDVRVLPDGSVVYDPDRAFQGTDRFAYTIVGEDGRRRSATVEVVVTAPVVAPAWIGGKIFDVPQPTLRAPSEHRQVGFVAVARVLLETVRELDTPLRLFVLSGVWVGILLLWLWLRRRRAFYVEGVSRGQALDVLDRPDGERRFSLRFDDGPVWSDGRRRRVQGRTWVPVRTRVGSGFVELERLLVIDMSADPPRSVLDG